MHEGDDYDDDDRSFVQLQNELFVQHLRELHIQTRIFKKYKLCFELSQKPTNTIAIKRDQNIYNKKIYT